MIPENPELLRALMADAKKQPPEYQPGPFWRKLAENAATQIESLGLQDFRGDSNSIGMGYTDSVYLDVRHALSSGTARRALRKVLSSFPVGRIFDSQVALARYHADATRKLRRQHMESNPCIPELLSRHILPETLRGGCVETVEIQGHTLSMHYLTLLDTMDRLSRCVDFTSVRSFFEIGGGFGANVHLLLENYPNIRKVLYLDIPPNLYVGTQYLKSFYGESVTGYPTRVQFKPDDSLEILCIAPWQVEQVPSVDLFYNAHSFVEMPESVVASYSRHVRARQVVMLSYLPHNPDTTFSPERLPSFFAGRHFVRYEHPMLDGSQSVVGYLEDPEARIFDGSCNADRRRATNGVPEYREDESRV